MPDVHCACGKPVPDQAYLCGDCTGHLRGALTALLEHAGDLQLTITRQARLGALTSGRSNDDERPLPFNPTASDVAWVALNTTSTWARHLASTRGLPAPFGTIAATTRLLTANLEWIRHQPDATDALDELVYASRLVVRVIDRPPGQVFAGPCTVCRTRLYAREGARTTICPGCHTEHDVADRQADALTAATDVLAHAALLAAAVTRLAQPVTADQVKGWARRGRIDTHGTDPRGRPLYRVGDVLDLLRDATHTPTRKATA